MSTYFPIEYFMLIIVLYLCESWLRLALQLWSYRNTGCSFAMFKHYFEIYIFTTTEYNIGFCFNRIFKGDNEVNYFVPFKYVWQYVYKNSQRLYKK